MSTPLHFAIFYCTEESVDSKEKGHLTWKIEFFVRQSYLQSFTALKKALTAKTRDTSPGTLNSLSAMCFGRVKLEKLNFFCGRDVVILSNMAFNT